MGLFSNKLSAETKKALTPEVKPTRKVVQNLFDDTHTQINILIFGPTGSGKTYSLVDLLLMGYKLFIVNGDIGGNGLLTIKLAIKDLLKTGKITQKLFDEIKNNIRYFNIGSYEQAMDFLDNPKALYPEIYEFDPDFMIFEGLAVFQQYDIYEKIQDNVINAAEGKDKALSEAREAGMQFETPEWGQLRNATIKVVAKFFKLHNTKTGKVWHKIITSHEKEGSVTKKDGKTNVSMIVEMKAPLIQGAAQSLVAGGFDLIIRTSKEQNLTNEKVDIFKYHFRDNSSKWSKDRGFGLDKMDADMGKLWNIICEKADIKMGATNKDLVVEE